MGEILFSKPVLLFSEPTIITDGLLLHLDAGDSNSYPGSGSTWFDISGNNHNATLVNGPTYSTTNGGLLNFNGSSQRGVINSTELGNIGASNHTISAWVNNDIVTEEDFIGTNGTSDGHILLMIFGGTSAGGSFRGHVWGSSGAAVPDSPNFATTGNWHYLTQRVNWTTRFIEIFEEGQLVQSASMSSIGSPVNTNSGKFIIGHRTDTNNDSSHFDGKIAEVQVYNRALSTTEIQENYNVTKSRFGL